MNKNVSVLGLMSGTSLDGLDIAHCTFSLYNKWHFEIKNAETYTYPDVIKKSLEDAMSYSEEDLQKLDHQLGHFYAEKVNAFLKKYNIDVELIASHGHTIFHRPEQSITLQIGNGRIIADKTGITTINDFRSADVKSGGQGAPLVPVGDELLFGEYNACINLGGFANISYKDEKQERIAYDIGPCNLILNYAANKLSLPYDKNGSIAQKGKVNKKLISRLQSFDFYQDQPPKSLGREWLNEEFFPVLKIFRLSSEDMLASFTDHISNLIANELGKIGLGKVLITGGGAYNSFLIDKIKQKTKHKVMVPEPLIIEYKEAMIFAFMGVLRTMGKVNIFSTVTGAPQDHSAGRVHKKT